jgi:DNA-binding CsgD family transcriptional regulator
VISIGDVMDYDVFLKGRFFLEWAHPQGWQDNIVGILSKSGNKLGVFAVSLKRRATHEDKSAVSLFLPHVTRAVAISDLLQFRTAEVGRLTAAVDGLTTGVVFLSSDLKVLDINAAAERMTRERHAIAIESGRLLLPNSEMGRKLRSAVAACAHGRLDELRISTVVFEGRDGAPGLVTHVLPLAKSEGSLEGGPAAALFLTDPEAPMRMPIDALIEQFGLTPSELRVLMGLMQGQTPREIAEAHGMAMPTIRTHLRHLFQKTGTSRQIQLVKLAMSMNPPQLTTNGEAKLS